MTIDEIYLSEAVKEAQIGLEKKEEPVGAVVVIARRVLGRAHHQTQALRDPTAHAVMIALTQAAGTSKNGKLKGAQVYATQTPCRMCLAAAELAGIRRIVHGSVRKHQTAAKIKLVGPVLLKTYRTKKKLGC